MPRRWSGEAGETWVALRHRPGPAAPRTGSLLEDPRSGQRVAFLMMQGGGPAGVGA